MALSIVNLKVYIYLYFTFIKGITKNYHQNWREYSTAQNKKKNLQTMSVNAWLLKYNQNFKNYKTCL